MSMNFPYTLGSKVETMAKNKVKKQDRVIDNSLLTKFIKQEMELNKVDQQGFAKLVKVSHSTIGRIINNKDEPSLATLIKISKGTNADIAMIISLASGQEIKGVKPESLLLAERIERLPDNVKQLIDNVIINALLTQERNDKNGGEISITKK